MSGLGRIRPARTAYGLMAADAVLAVVSAAAAYKLRFLPHDSWWALANVSPEAAQPYLHLLCAAPLVRVCSGWLTGLYRVRRRAYRISDDLGPIAGAVLLGSALLVLIAFFGVFQYRTFLQFRGFNYSRFFFVFDALLYGWAVCAFHSFAGLVRNEAGRRGWGVRRAAIQGTGSEAQLLAAEHNRLAEAGYALAGIIGRETQGPPLEAGGRRLPYLGSSGDILGIINAHNVDEIIVTEPSDLGRPFIEFAGECHEVDVVTRIVPDLYGLMFRGQPVDELAGLPLVQVNEVGIGGAAKWVKRVEDVVLSGAGLIVFAPLLLGIALCVGLSSPGPVLFRQERLGKNGRIFTMLKFRTMRLDADAAKEQFAHLNSGDGPVFKIRKDPRVTPLGRFLRRYALDELPQLVNVLRGEMSLVGPRPLPVSDIAHPGDWERQRFAAVPGMTGLWQVNRSGHSAGEMLKWDLYYVENWSLWLDFRILLKTFAVVAVGKESY